MLVHNPVLRGFNPDPCLCCARGVYYMATSTFQWVPGVSIYASDDLAHWRCLGGALTGIDLRGVPDSAGIWAPDLTFDGTRFWLVYTVCKQIDGIFKDVENYAICAENIEGPWSEPMFVNASGFDPGMFHEDGRHYVLNPQWDPRSLPGHHRFNGLVMQEFTLGDGLVGEAQLVLGNSDAVNWLREGPHIMKRNGWYYIACAEGGTGRRHRIRMARSRSLWGPYEMDADPLVTSWCQDVPLRRAGHGNLLQADDGAWYVCHLCSRYLDEGERRGAFGEHEAGVSPLGRETALQRVVWRDGWPRLADGGIAPYEYVEISGASECACDNVPSAGEPGFQYRAEFSSVDCLWRDGWMVPRHIDKEALQVADGMLMLAGGDSPSSWFDRSCLSRRVLSHAWYASVSCALEPVHYNQSAGLICEYDARAFAYVHLGLDEAEGCRVVDVLTCANGEFQALLGAAGRLRVPAEVAWVRLGVAADGAAMRFYAAWEGEPLQPLLDASGTPLAWDASVMSDERIDGWAYTGQMIGVTCVDMWDKTASARMRAFEYGDGDHGGVWTCVR